MKTTVTYSTWHMCFECSNCGDVRSSNQYVCSSPCPVVCPACGFMRPAWREVVGRNVFTKTRRWLTEWETVKTEKKAVSA